MFEPRGICPGVETGPKAEFATAFAGPYTVKRLYLMPIRVRSHTRFSQYDWDFQVVVKAPNTISYKCAVYERVGALQSSALPTPNYGNLVPGTLVTVTGVTAAFQTTALGATKSLVPGDYFIAFIYDIVLAGTLSCLNTIQNNTWVLGPWVYDTAVSTFTMPSTLAGPLAYIMGANENPFWCALTYAGDVIP